MDRNEFIGMLRAQGDVDQLGEVCKKYLLHGTPFVFAGREDDFFEFRRRIADQFRVGFHEVFIVGSAKLGFSPYKEKLFDLDSDIDVVIVSESLFSEFLLKIKEYQMQLRRARMSTSVREQRMYHEFLEYTALGWFRPDKLPISFSMSSVKDGWFEFFRSISHGRSEVGNYKVSAGVFRSYNHLEDYLLEGLRETYQAEKVAGEK